MISKEDKMMNILQSFVDIAEPQLYKYDNLEEDVEATKWAINRIKELEIENKELKKKLTPEAMLKELKRSKLYERSTEDDIQSKKDTGTNKFSRSAYDRGRTESSKRDTVKL